MTEEDGFLLDILAHPDDPAGRCAYADWLADQNDPRASLFRRVSVAYGLARTAVERRRWEELLA
jgi:uncharacterized protein (TIGR02996 family)